MFDIAAILILGAVGKGIHSLFSGSGSCDACGGSGRCWDVALGTYGVCSCQRTSPYRGY
jgi:hypothetical protein